MKQKLADVVDVVVVHNIVLVHVLGARPIATQYDSPTAKMMQMITGERDALAVKVHPDTCAAA